MERDSMLIPLTGDDGDNKPKIVPSPMSPEEGFSEALRQVSQLTPEQIASLQAMVGMQIVARPPKTDK